MSGNMTQAASTRRGGTRRGAHTYSHVHPLSRGILAAATLLHQAWTRIQKPSPARPVALTEIDKTQEPLWFIVYGSFELLKA